MAVRYTLCAHCMLISGPTMGPQSRAIRSGGFSSYSVEILNFPRIPLRAVASIPNRRNYSEPVFLNVYGAQESIPRNQFRDPM
jgi:hypothetical protein